MALNTVHSRRREVVPIDLTPDAGGTPALIKYMKEDLVQLSRDGKTGYVVTENPGAGFASVTGLFAATAGARAFETKTGDFVLKNANIQMTISDGRIVSLFDVKLERELIPTGQTAGLQMFTDK